MGKIMGEEIILDTEEKINNFINAIKKEKIDNELIEKALLLNKKRLVTG